MESKDRSFKAVDVLYLVLAIIPLVCGMVLKIFTEPASSGIEIAGPRIYFTIPMPVQNLPITESQVNSWLVIISIFWVCKFLTHGLSVIPQRKRQAALEWVIEKTDGLVASNMGSYFMGFSPFVAAIMVLSAFSSLLTLLNLYPPTSDLNVVAGWALLVFILITYYKLKCGPVHYLKSFGDPVPFLAPLNVISEFATPVSMAFRHYGNILSGTVISTLVAAALQGISALVFGKLPGILGDIPFLQVGLPAILSVYFDLFSGCLQAFIFAMLTMLYISGAFPFEEYMRRMAKKKTVSES